jgi:hypothetical protein
MKRNKPATPRKKDTIICSFCGDEVFSLSACINKGQADRCYHFLKK